MIAGLIGVAAVTWIYTTWLAVSNATTVAMTFLMVVLVVAATARLRDALVTSVAAVLCFNFFFLPPVGTFTIADPNNWVAVFAFLAVSFVASTLSAVARARTAEALGRRDGNLAQALMTAHLQGAASYWKGLLGGAEAPKTPERA